MLSGGDRGIHIGISRQAIQLIAPMIIFHFFKTLLMELQILAVKFEDLQIGKSRCEFVYMDIVWLDTHILAVATESICDKWQLIYVRKNCIVWKVLNVRFSWAA